MPRKSKNQKSDFSNKLSLSVTIAGFFLGFAILFVASLGWALVIFGQIFGVRDPIEGYIIGTRFIPHSLIAEFVTLFTIGTLLAGIPTLLAVLIFRHTTKKWIFWIVYGIILLITAYILFMSTTGFGLGYM